MRWVLSQQGLCSISRTVGAFLLWYKRLALMLLPFCISHFTSPESAGIWVKAK